MIKDLQKKVLDGGEISRDEALSLISVDGGEMMDLFCAANTIRGRFRGPYIDLCAIVNARSGGCPEDCAYCAQSSKSSADIAHFPLLGDEMILEKAREARAGGARRFCIVTSGRKVSGRDLDRVAAVVAKVRSIGLLPCATLGLLSEGELRLLRDSGLERYHHMHDSQLRGQVEDYRGREIFGAFAVLRRDLRTRGGLGRQGRHGPRPSTNRSGLGPHKLSYAP